MSFLRKKYIIDSDESDNSDNSNSYVSNSLFLTNEFTKVYNDDVYNTPKKPLLDDFDWKKYLSIYEDDMKKHIETFENKVLTFTKSEINVLKIISKLQEALSKISLEENVKLIAPR